MAARTALRNSCTLLSGTPSPPSAPDLRSSICCSAIPDNCMASAKYLEAAINSAILIVALGVGRAATDDRKCAIASPGLAIRRAVRPARNSTCDSHNDPLTRLASFSSIIENRLYIFAVPEATHCSAASASINTSYSPR